MDMGEDVFDEEAQIDLGPMIDMVFLLLIFFMVSSHMNQLEKVEVDIPVAEHAKVAKDMKDRYVITVNKEGDIFFGSKSGKMEDIQPMVKKYVASTPALKIFLRGDKDAEHQYVRDVMKECAAAGASEILFSTYEK